MIDYRKILIAYIEHVVSCEGTDFMPDSLDGLTPEEYEALVNLDIPHHPIDQTLADGGYLKNITPTMTPFLEVVNARLEGGDVD
jgi:hypothetical protein